MATPSTGQTSLDKIRDSILHFISALVSPRLYQAIKFVLQPCCNITATGITATKVSAGVYNVVVSLSNATSFFNAGFAYLLIGNNTVSGPLSFTDGTTITFSNVTVAAGTYNVSLLVNMAATNSGATAPYVGFNTPSVSVVFPA